MVRNEKEKAAALILTAVCIVISVSVSVLDGFSVESVAISPHCSIFQRLVYPLFHASMLHCIVNCWCLLSVVFAYHVSFSSMLLAYLTAVLYPVDTFAIIPAISPAGHTVGLSAVCFSLLGQIAFQVQRKLYYQFCIISFIAFGYIIPWASSACGYAVATPNNLLHIYSYVVGLLVGFLNSPAPWQK